MWKTRKSDTELITLVAVQQYLVSNTAPRICFFIHLGKIDILVEKC